MGICASCEVENYPSQYKSCHSGSGYNSGHCHGNGKYVR